MGKLPYILEMTPQIFAKQFSRRTYERLPIEIVSGIEGSSVGGGNINAYQSLFLDRYHKLSSIIRPQMRYVIPISAATSGRYDVPAFIGIVSDIKTTKKSGARLITLEDPTDQITVIFAKGNECFHEVERIQLDEVIGVIASANKKDKYTVFGKDIIRPNIPLNHIPNRSPVPAKVCMISDVHVGSNTFLPEAWERFLRWIVKSDINYLLVAGDVVDGIGVYPGQDEELYLKNIHAQYDELGRMLSRIPSHIRVVISMGNHDVVRMAEPQPALPEKYRTNFPDHVIFVENPAYLNLSGVNILMYHGKSFDDLIKNIPGASYTNIPEIMVEMLQMRHISPSYGLRTPLLPAYEDKLLIDPIPDVLLTGHVHISGIETYRKVLCVNPGCWQGQTKYQKLFNTVPTPGRAVVLDLHTFKYTVENFL